MNIHTCSHCGAIHVDDSTLSPIKRRILYYISKHPGCEIDALMDYVYANDPDGGASTKTLYTHMHQLRQRLHPQGLTVQNRTGPGTTYRLVQRAIP
jgi:DNA-binding response OmpR family regulator